MRYAKRRVILASASKRRAGILKACGIRHTVMPSGADERPVKGLTPAGQVVTIAERKAELIAGRAGRAVVIGVDTMVFFGGRLIGKPRSKAAARKMLAEFNGKRIGVYTGICVIDTVTGRRASGSERSGVRMAKVAPGEIDRYFAYLGPHDKAGGFSIEGIGSILFDDVAGSYFNVLGLPTGKLRELFGKIGLDLLDFVRR